MRCDSGKFWATIENSIKISEKLVKMIEILEKSRKIQENSGENFVKYYKTLGNSGKL